MSWSHHRGQFCRWAGLGWGLPLAATLLAPIGAHALEDPDVPENRATPDITPAIEDPADGHEAADPPEPPDVDVDEAMEAGTGQAGKVEVAEPASVDPTSDDEARERVTQDGEDLDVTSSTHGTTEGSPRLKAPVRDRLYSGQRPLVTPEQLERSAERLHKVTLRHQITALSMLATSGAAIATGATLLGIDGKPVRRRCRGDGQPDVDCPHRHQTEVAGTVVLAIGAATLFASGVFALWSNQRTRNLREQHRRLQLSGTGLTIAF